MITDWEFPGTVVTPSAATFQKRDSLNRPIPGVGVTPRKGVAQKCYSLSVGDFCAAVGLDLVQQHGKWDKQA